MPKREVVKVQLPLASSDDLQPGEGSLIYAEGRDRSIVGTPVPPAVAAAVRKGGGKAFAYAEWDGRRWNVLRPAPRQEW